MKRRPLFSLTGWPVIIFVSSLVLSACSLPRIIVLHDPLSANEHDDLGRSYEAEGKDGPALEQYREALKKDPKHLPSLLLLGDLSFRMKNYDDAASAYAKALALEPGNADVRNNLAWVYIQMGKKLDTAKELVREALDLNPAHRPYYLDTLGVVLLKTGNVAAAIEALKESVNTIPKERQEMLAEAEGHLADAVKKASENGGAVPK